MHVYTPDKYTITFGFPSLDTGIPELPATSVELEDWVSMTSAKQVKRFNFLQGVVSNEPFVDYIPNRAKVFSLSILQTSQHVQDLRRLITLQEIGFLGMPFSVIDNGTDTNSDQPRQKSIYNAFIEDEPDESFALQGATWLFNIIAVYGTTNYFNQSGIVI